MKNSISTVSLGQVARLIRGITFTPADLVTPYSTGSVICMRTANIQAELDEKDVIAVPRSFVKRDEQLIRPGDMLVSSANSWNLVGKCVWVSKLGYSATAGGFISILRADSDRIHPRYLFHWFTSDKTQHLVRRCGRQTTNISNLDHERCLGLLLPLPPIPEQQRIASILDKAHSVEKRQREMMQISEQLLDCIFADMFGSVLSRRSRFPFVRFRAFLSVASGKSAKEVLSDEPTGIPVFGGNGQNGWAMRALYDEPVIVVGRVGQQCGITRMTDGPCWVTDNAIVVQIQDRTKVHPDYLEAALQRSPLRSTVEYIDLPFINQSIILDQPLPLPPLEIQLEFARRKAAQRTLLQNVQESAHRARDLLGSLTQRAFRGEL